MSPSTRVLCTIALFVFSVAAFAQVSDKIARVTTSPVQQGQPLTVTAELINPALVSRVEVNYRQFGEQQYKRMEMSIVGNSATATIPGTETLPPFLEFYLLLTTQTPPGTETYPVENAADHPLRAEVQEAIAPAGVINLISPEPRESVSAEDLLVSFSLSADSTVDLRATKVFIDGADLSAFLVATGNLFVLRPSNSFPDISPGTHLLGIEVYSQTHALLDRMQSEFTLTGRGERPAAPAADIWQYGGSVQLESRNEKIDTLPGVPYNRATLTARASRGSFRTQGKIYLTNEEKADRQPQDRFNLTAELPWISVGLGDLFPVYSDLIMNGRRVRGVNGDLRLGAFGLSVTEGQILREIEGDTIMTFPADSLQAEQLRDPTGAYRSYDATRWAKIQSGTFSRNILVVRPQIGRENSRFGFTFLKSGDDPGSIRFGIKPQENLVAGSDFLLSWGNHAVELGGQAAMSATNRDITRGTFSDADIDSLYPDPDYSQSTRNNIRRVRDILSHFMTVNENLIPLAAAHMPTLAYEGGLAVNAFNNAFRFTWLRHGSSFESFGQSYVRPDVEGFNVSDRARVMSNQLLITAGVERLRDNTTQTKLATTTMTTVNTGVTYFPKSELPSVTVAYLLAENKNDYPVDSLATNDITNRVVFQIGKGFSWYGQHQGSLSVSTSVRDDRTPRALDTKATTVALGVTSSYAIPLQTMISLLVSANTLPFIDSTGRHGTMKRNYTTFSARGQYRCIPDKLLLSAALSPTFGDIGRTVIDGNLQYFITPQLSTQAQATVYLNNDRNSDLIGMLVVRMDF